MPQGHGPYFKPPSRASSKTHHVRRCFGQQVAQYVGGVDNVRSGHRGDVLSRELCKVNSKDPTVTALPSLTVTATEGYTTMKDLTRLPTRELLASRMDAHVTTQSRALYSPQPTCTRSRNPSRIPSERQGTKLRGNSMHHSLHVGLTLEVTLLGKRANYTLRAEVIGLDSAIAQLRTATGQTLNVPLEAIADVKRIDVRTPPRSPELSLDPPMSWVG